MSRCLGPVFGSILGILAFSVLPGCESATDPFFSSVPASDSLSAGDVGTLLAHAVEVATDHGEAVSIAVTDREGNVLGGFRMTGAQTTPCVTLGLTPFDAVDALDEAVQKARTAAYLSSDQHGFTTLTACFITRNHFPPEVTNLPAGPLLGVPLSSLRGADIQPNGSGLTGAPGGVPVYKDGDLVGGLGVSGGSDCGTFAACLCACELADELIARGAVIGYSVPEEERGDNIFLDGIRLLFGNVETPVVAFSLTYADLAGLGVAAPAPQTALPRRFPFEGEVDLGGVFDFSINGSGMVGGLTGAEVRRIIDQARAQADRTRAAIRRPIGSPARVFISVTDLDGTVLGIWRTPDATLFSMDVSAQKARTAVAFSSPACTAVDCPAPALWLGRQIRDLLGLAPGDPLAMTSRAVGFLAQEFFPPGIDEETLEQAVVTGPLFEVQEGLAAAPEYANLGPFGNGLTIFPGGIPLYKNGQLVGGIGVSGDGVDQDDIIAAAGTVGFEPPADIRCDQFFFDEVRLPYVKYPRQAEIE